MSRLTGKEAFGLMEAYQAVYAPQELTEEQVWEGVENWVHSLLEEGYDLSDYTWEEMYEGYITELMKDRPQYDPRFNVPQPKSSSNPVFDFLNAPNVRQNATNAARTGIYGRYGTPSAQVKVAPVPNFDTDQKARDRYGLPPKKSTTPTPARPAAPTPARPAAPAPSVRPVVPSTPSNGNGPKVIQRPGAPAPRPATAPDSKMGGDPMDQWARANPTLAAKVKPGQSGYNTIRTRLDADNDRQENYDAYDLVLSHLINEGYADTQEAALAIMGNMSEEWREEILDEEVRGAKKGTIRSVIERGGKRIKYVQSGGNIVAGDLAAAERASAADRTRSGENRANAARAEQARKNSIQNLNAISGEDSGDYDSGYYGDDDTSDGNRHYSLSHTNRDSHRRRASGR